MVAPPAPRKASAQAAGSADMEYEFWKAGNAAGQLMDVDALAELRQAHEKQSVSSRNEVREEDVIEALGTIRSLIHTRFKDLRRAFRLLDADKSGILSGAEIRRVLMMFNLAGISDNVLDKIIDLADVNGDGMINYAEFCRTFAPDGEAYVE